MIADSFSAVFDIFGRLNKYIDETEPWVLAKDEQNKSRLSCVLYNLLEAIRIATTLLACFMPTTMPKIFEQIGASEDLINYENAKKFGVLPQNVTVKKGDVLFPRIDAEKEIEELNAIISAQVEKAQKEQEKVEQVAFLDEISIDDFAKVDLRVAKVKACEPIKRAKKLLKLTLDDGSGEDRTVASGIAQYYKPEDLIGKNVIVVANLKPATLCGVESRGMILAADTDEGIKVIFPEGLPAGAKIR